MGIRITSIQSRDQVDIQNPQAGPKTALIREDNPIPKGLGDTVDKYADFIQKKEAEALRNTRNIRAAMVKNKFADFENQATTKVLDAQGENTFKATDVAGQELKKNIAKELEKFPAQYRTEYANFAQDSIQRFNKTSQGRMISEGRKAGEEAFKRRSEDLTGRTVLNAYDPQEFQTSLLELDQTVEQHSQLTIGDESPRARELINIHKKEARSTALIKTVETLAASGDVTKANQIAQEYKDSFTANDLTKAYKLLEEGKVKRDLDTAKSLADTALSNFGDDEAAGLQWIRQSTQDGRLSRDAGSDYTAMVSAQRRTDLAKRKETFGDMQSKVLGGQRLTTEDYAKLDAGDAVKIRELQVKVSRGETIPRNSAVWNRMQDMFVNEPEKFAQQSFNDIQYQLPNTDMNTLRRMRTSLLDPLAEKFKPQGSNYIRSEFLRQIKAKPGTSRYQEEVAAINDMYTTAFLNGKAALGERGTQAELDSFIREEMAVKSLRLKDNRNVISRIFSDPKPSDMVTVPSPAQKGSKRFNTGARSPILGDFEQKDQDAAQATAVKEHGRRMTETQLINYLSRRADKGIIKRKSDN